MIYQKISGRDGLHLTDDGTKMLVDSMLNYLQVFSRKVINFNVDFHFSGHDILSWQYTKFSDTNTYIEEAGHKSRSNAKFKKTLL